MTKTEQERLAVLETKVDTLERMLKEIRDLTRNTDATINQAKGARWMLLTLVATIPAGAVYALVNVFKSGTPTH